MTQVFTFIKRDSSLTDDLKPCGNIISNNIGDPGSNGKNGASLYFIDYEPSNTFYKKSILNRIDNNLIISSTIGEQLQNRTYTKGDLIITPKMNMYRLIDPPLNSLYKFDLEYIGRIFSNINRKTPSVVNSLIEVGFKDYEYCNEKCVVPVNRSMDFDGNRGYLVITLKNLISNINSNEYKLRFKFIVGEPFAANVDSIIDASVNLTNSTINAIEGSDGILDRLTNSIQSELYNKSLYYGEDEPTKAKVIKNDVNKTITIYPPKVYGVSTNDDKVLRGDVHLYENITIQSTTQSVDLESGKTFKDGTDNSNFKLTYTVEEKNDKTLIQLTHPSLKNTKDSGEIPSTYNLAYRGLYGIDFIPIVRFSDENIANKYNFYLRIYLKNKKSIQHGCYGLKHGFSDNFTDFVIQDPVQSNLYEKFTFSKCIELKLDPYFNNTRINQGTDNELDYKYTITDMAMDKLHPSSNNINISSLLPESDKINSYGDYYWCGIIFQDINAIDYSKDSVYRTEYYTKLKQKTFTNAKEEYEYFKNSFDASSYELNHNITQYSKRSIESNNDVPINFRGGESVYFSGMTIPSFNTSITIDGKTTKAEQRQNTLSAAQYSTYDSYVCNILSTNKNINVEITPNESLVNGRENLTINYVSKKIEDFLLSDDNVFELVCVKKEQSIGDQITQNGGEVIIYPISPGNITKLS